MTRTPRLRLFGRPLIILSWTLMCCVAHGGGGPENVFLVVNSRSWSSRTIANHYQRLRRIPPTNVFYLDWNVNNGIASINVFRSTLLTPVIDEIDRRRLGSQIDYVVYSSDFPIRVYFHADLKENQKPKYPAGSLTGLTFLAQLVQARNVAYAARGTNWYMPKPMGNGGAIPTELDGPTRGFRSSYAWGQDSKMVTASEPHQKYLLSTMLSYTSGTGNSVAEVINYLERSALADGTHPQGDIYYMDSGDVRSAVRQPAFGAAIDEIRKRSVAAGERTGTLPPSTPQIQGVTFGTKTYDWPSSESAIAPGAICDNLTSYGGVLFAEQPQTPLSESLRYGAAGASGTIIEPFAAWWKFPHPMLHAHYARGCTLAEAFYQSVYSPYQLLIVGDPLCRPWATVPLVNVKGVVAGETVNGVISLTPTAILPDGFSVDQFELFVDGLRVAVCEPTSGFQLDTAELSDGYHELRVVAVESSLIQSQGRIILPVNVKNRNGTVTLTTRPVDHVRAEQTLTLTAQASGARAIKFYHGDVELGRVNGSKGSIHVDPIQLGFGPVVVRAMALGGKGPTSDIASAPKYLTIENPRPLRAARGLARPSSFPGLALINSKGRTLPLGNTTDPHWIKNAGIGLNEDFEIIGYLRAPESGLYQFEFEYLGYLDVSVNDVPLHRLSHRRKYEHFYLPVALDRGLHRLRIQGRLEKIHRFFAAFGSRGTLPLNHARFALE